MNNSIGLAPKVRLGDWIGEGWNMFVAEWKVWVVNALILFGVVAVPIGAMLAMFILLGPSSPLGDGLPVAVIPLLLLVVGLVIFAQAYLMGGMYRCAFRQLRGEPISTADLFSGGDKMISVLGALILVGLLTALGTMLCVIPGFIVAGALYFTLPLVIERDLGVIDAMTASRDTTRGDLLMFVLFAFLVGLISQAGAYVCYVGLLVTLPLQFTIGAVAFRDCFGVPGARSFSSKPTDQQHYGAPPPLAGYGESPWRSSGYGPAAQNSTPSPGPQGGATVTPSVIGPSATPEGAVGQDSPAGNVTPQLAGQVVCPACQAVLPATARFCARCGRSLTEP